MSSLRKIKTKTGEGWRIEIVLNGDRKSLFLGKGNKKASETIQSRVDQIQSCNLAGMSYPPDVAQWLGTIGDELHNKLSKVGLVEVRKTATLEGFLQSNLDERVDLKPRTKQKYATSIKSLTGYFGNVKLKEVTAEKAAIYRVHLVRSGYKTATISKMIGVARLFFNVAKRRKLVDDNPFSEVETGSQINKDREHFVTETETQLLINACPNAKARLIIALGRYAGLRIPSELRGLRWSEVNWEAGRFIVHSPKTEGKGKAKRVVPIFGELRPYLADAFELAPEGEDRIFPEIGEKSRWDRGSKNWLTGLVLCCGRNLFKTCGRHVQRSC